MGDCQNKAVWDGVKATSEPVKRVVCGDECVVMKTVVMKTVVCGDECVVMSVW